MRAISHATTGALIGLVIVNPVIAMPVALISHFVCDALPHWDGVASGNGPKIQWVRSALFQNILYADALLCFALVSVLAIRQPEHWQLAVVCAFLAAAPDFLSIKFWWAARHDRPLKFGPYTRFASRIQWFERPLGAVFEVPWLIGAVAILVPYLL